MSRFLPLLGAFGAFVLGAVFLIAVWGKMLDPEAFAEQIRSEGIAVLPPLATALSALALEAGLGTALLLGVRRLSVLVPTALLVVFFLFLTARSYWLYSQGLLDESAACGCFGNLVSRTPAEAFWQDLLLLVPPLLLAFLGRRGGRPPVLRLALAGVVATAVALFAWKAPELPLDDVATRLRPGVEVGALCTGGEAATSICLDGLVPELTSGRHLAILAALDDPALGDAVPALNELAAAGGVTVWVLTASTPEEQTAFYWERGPVFEVREAPEALLRPLHRRLPRTFEVVDGRVVATRPGLPVPAGGDLVQGSA